MNRSIKLSQTPCLQTGQNDSRFQSKTRVHKNAGHSRESSHSDPGKEGGWQPFVSGLYAYDLVRNYFVVADHMLTMSSILRSAGEGRGHWRI